MPIILSGFVLFPLLAGFVLEYLSFRLTMYRRKWIRPLPPLLLILFAAVVLFYRYRVWGESDVSPMTQLIFVPGLPALFGMIGMVLGWRLWKRLWDPRVIRDKTKGEESF